MNQEVSKNVSKAMKIILINPKPFIPEVDMSHFFIYLLTT